MKRRPEKFPEVEIRSVNFLAEWKREKWDLIEKHYSNRIQFDLLRALTVSAVVIYAWEDIFEDFYSGVGVFASVNKNWFEHKQAPTYDELLTLIIQSGYFYCTIPTPEPIWLIERGYTQFQYIADLKECWTDIESKHYTPWPSSRVGYDTLEYDTIKQISQETQTDIEQLIQSAKLVLHLVNNGDSHDYQNDETEADHV